MSEFDMTKFKTVDDGTWMNGANPNDKVSKDNLIEVGVSENLARGLDGKTVGEFKEILIDHLKGDAVNQELKDFGKAVFAAHHETGYEDPAVNAAIWDVERLAMDKFPRASQGLVYDYDTSSAVTPEGKSAAPLPATLQVEPELAGGDMYFKGIENPTVRAMNEMKL